MNLYIPEPIILMALSMLAAGVIGLLFFFFVIGIEMSVQGLHRLSPVYYRSIILWHLVWSKRHQIEELSTRMLQRAIRHYIKECPNDGILEKTIQEAKTNLKNGT